MSGAHGNTDDSNGWRRFLETPEEFNARIHTQYVIDPETNDILTRRLTPYEKAVLNGRDWFEMAKVEVPEGYDMPSKPTIER